MGEKKSDHFPPEPESLDSMDAWRDIVLRANYMVIAGNPDEAARLMTRLFTECALNDCERIIVAGGEAYIESSHKTGKQAELLRDQIAKAGRAAAADDFAAAHEIFRKLVADLRVEPGPSLRIGLIALGIQGVAARKK